MRTMKSKEARTNWAQVVSDAEAGRTTVIEHYNRPVAMVVPYRPARLRAVAHTYNDRTGAAVTIQGIPMSDASDYPDAAPSADGHVPESEGWVLQDRGESAVRVTAPTIEAAVMAWAQKLGHRLAEIVVDPVYPPDPDAGPGDW